MRYCGGKAKIGRKIAAILNPIIQDKGIKTYWEPFVGACGVMRHIEAPVRIGTDIDPDIIGLWQAMQAGWEPPSMVTEEDYHRIKADPGSVDVAMRAFVAWGCSFGGKKWGGYARSGKRNYAANARSSLLSRISLSGVKFACLGYRDRMIADDRPLVYCDPPYAGTTNGGPAFKGFDHAAFWEWADELTSSGAHVFVSEYDGPDGWASIDIDARQRDMSRRSSRVERLFFKAAG